MTPLMLFKIGSFHVARWLRVRVNEALKDTTAFVDLTLALLEFQESVPSILSRLPSHPIFENVAGALNLSKHLLHERIFVPKLVDPGHVLAGSLPNVTC